MVETPLYIIGMPKNEFGAELIRTKFLGIIKRLCKVYSKIEEARMTIKRQRTGGKKHSYEVLVLIITPKKIHTYREVGWDLSNVCEKLGQKLLRTLTKHDNRRLKTSIRKIKMLEEIETNSQS